VCLFLIQACTHWEQVETASSGNSIDLKPRTSCEPDYSDGRLNFTDSAEYICFLDYLYDLTYGDSTLISVDSILNEIESDLGHVSLRSQAFDQDGDYDPDLSQDIFLGDDILRSVLNEYYEVRVGTNIVVHQCPTALYIIDGNSSSASSSVTKLRNSIKGELLPLSDLDTNMTVIHFGDDQTDLGPRSPLCDYKIFIDQDRCLDPLSVTITVEYRGQLTTDECRGTVNLGDGTTINLSPPAKAFLISHTYTSYAVLTVAFDFKGEILGVPDQCNYATSRSVDTRSRTCEQKLMTVEVSKVSTDGQYRLIQRVSSDFDGWGYYVANKTIAQKLISSKFKSYKVDRIDSDIEATFRNVNCIYQDDEADFDFCRNCKDELARRRESWSSSYHANGDVLGRAKIREGSLQLSQTQSLPHCQ